MTKTHTSTILIADDDPQFVRLLEHHLRGWSYRVVSACHKSQLFRLLTDDPPDLLLLDVRFGEHDGVEILRQLPPADPGLRVVMLTAFGSIDNAIAAIRLGAFEYLTKPVDLNRLHNVVLAALDRPAGASATAPTTDGAPELSRPILGDAPATRVLRELIVRIAPTDASVLITGESGTGKELVARALHELSGRRGGPFVAVNVAALPRELVESTLFGHAKGAFTGADKLQHGCCEAADGGTLFLDEIGEMEIGLQAKLLRFLQERTFQRVGQSTAVTVDVRIVSATNRDPLEQVRRGLFREDLYYRLNVVPIPLTPLRERREDVATIARSLLERARLRLRRGRVVFRADALDALTSYDWPGNVRELENVVERLAILTPGDEITAAHVAPELTRAVPPALASSWSSTPLPGGEHLREFDRIELAAIIQALDAVDGNVRQAARTLGLGQATVYRKIKKYNIPVR